MYHQIIGQYVVYKVGQSATIGLVVGVRGEYDTLVDVWYAKAGGKTLAFRQWELEVLQ